MVISAAARAAAKILAKQKYKQYQKAYRKAHSKTPEAIAKRKVYHQRPEVKAKENTPERKAYKKEYSVKWRERNVNKVKAYNKSYYQIPEVRAKSILRAKARNQLPEVKVRRNVLRRTQYKAKADAYAKEYVQRPEVKERRLMLQRERRRKQRPLFTLSSFVARTKVTKEGKVVPKTIKSVTYKNVIEGPIMKKAPKVPDDKLWFQPKNMKVPKTIQKRDMTPWRKKALKHLSDNPLLFTSIKKTKKDKKYFGFGGIFGSLASYTFWNRDKKRGKK